ncbi:MAG: metallophosphoesterase [Bacteroidales bacterium]|uniref:metallophosphoesterase n=1 Tax=Porphyromonas sp. TaxID=1924944 RepID=UPI00297B1F7E|nr:metallophosphoesterase [Porphyromonas sp.]MDD7437334.1 metallophosphoesterase [Bacteroidales bacterium]MDY3066665.1 metallophosphoesterase [Porphyromonas sp.]
MRMIIISLFGQGLMNLLLLTAVWKGTIKGSIWRKIALGWVGLELLYFLFTIITQAYLNSKGEFLRVGGLMFSNYYIYIGVLMTLLMFGYFAIWILQKSGVIKGDISKRKARGMALIIFMPVTLILCIQGYYNTILPVVTRYDVSILHNGEPKELKIALVTDIHFGDIITKEQVRKMVKMVQAEHPDYVFVGGDQLDYYFHFVENDPEITTLIKSLHPDPSKIYHVLGNHEYYMDLEKKCDWLSSMGVLLRDQVVLLEDSIYLIGRDDAFNEQRLPLVKLMEQVPEGATSLVLDHQPTEPEEERANGVALSMHGHTHDGQFIPFKWIVGMRFENSYGYMEKDGTQYITSSGFGLSSSPIRIGTKSEIVIINLSLK